MNSLLVIEYNLQFFAKDGPGGQKTEPATPKKLGEARKDGNVPKSKDITGAVTLLAFFILLDFYLSVVGNKFIGSFSTFYNQIGDIDSADKDITFTSLIHGSLVESVEIMFTVIAPFFLVGFMVAFIMDLIQVKWKPTTKPLKPKFDKFNPINGIKRMFSIKTILELVKQIAIIFVCLMVTYQKIKSKLNLIYELYDMTLTNAIIAMGDLIVDIGKTISIVYVLIGIADYIYEKLKFKNDMKMTKQEVKDEMKNSEGNPEIKSKQRRRMQEASRRRMMQSVPTADVVITNPTHFAVALKYEPNSGRAPVVVAKGEDFLAQKIKEVARTNSIEIVENKPLARMLYYNVDLGAEIPPELYQAVAEVLAFVYNIKHAK